MTVKCNHSLNCFSGMPSAVFSSGKDDGKFPLEMSPLQMSTGFCQKNRDMETATHPVDCLEQV